ncbi:HAD-IA family hydrolase [Aeromicrobium sp. IC_218]|uniref:HAD family hydrolase n=1 Tax=Aeromicrobium sp. IC_218 TaxID=2545468 RepID=UPI001040D470|nr:HAD-IA family hydrolase [Aeromicrobium sp. IC_218]TCI99359.1 HAD family hydrolase [Aeromicrobium sp. IC_218]
MKHVVWDMDGTLLDSTRVVPDAFVGAIAELGGPRVARDDVVAAYSLGVPEVLLAHFLGRDLDEGEAEAYYGRLRDAQVAPYPGIAETLESLRSQGRQVAVFTGASTRAARTLLDAAGLTVDVLVGGDDVGRPKPAPDGVVEAARRLGAGPGHVVYVGDAPTDMQAARAAGAVAAAASWGHLYDPDEPFDHALTEPRDVLRLL